MWVVDIVNKFGPIQPLPLILFRQRERPALNPYSPARTQCLDIQYRWIIDNVKARTVGVEHIPRTRIVADGLTKPLLRIGHARFGKMLGLASMDIPWVDQRREKECC